MNPIAWPSDPLDLPVFTVPEELTRGVYAPGYHGKGVTYDWRQRPGSALNTRGVKTRETLPLREALTRSWPTEALMLNYVTADPNGVVLPAQPRVNKTGRGVEWIVEQNHSVFLTVIQFDFDTPGHVPWTPELLDAAQDEAVRCSLFRTFPWWYTRRGRRMVLPLRAPMDHSRAELAIEAAMEEARFQGLNPDDKCRDWTHLQRVPRWRSKSGASLNAEVKNLDVGEFYVAPQTTPRLSRPRPKRARVSATTPDFASELPREWITDRIATIARAVAAVSSEWHTLFLALSGALLERGVSASVLPAVIGAISTATTCDARTEDRVTGAKTTVQLSAAGEPILAGDALLVSWPGVSSAVDAAFRTTNSPELPTAAEAVPLIEQHYRNAPEGPSIINAGCGVGKTQAACTVMLERAGIGRSPAGRTRPGSKSILSQPRNDLAIETAAKIRAAGGSVLRLFSPASELDASGQPICRFHESAEHLARAGGSVGFEFCRGRDQSPCPHLSTCPAASGQSGDPDALIILGNHGLLSRLVAMAGTSGLKIIDEPPPMLETDRLVAADFFLFRQHAGLFASGAHDALWPLAQALEAFLVCASPDELPQDLPAAVERFREAVTVEDLELALGGPAESVPADVLLCARRAWEPGRRGAPLQRSVVLRARDNPAYAADVFRAARCAWILWSMASSDARQTLRVEDKDERVLLVTHPNEQFVRALRTPGQTVLTDASPDIAGLSAAAGFDLTERTLVVQARDGAPIKRTHLSWPHGSRTKLLEDGLHLGRLSLALEAVVSWAIEDLAARRLVIFGFGPVVVAIEAALRGVETVSRRFGLSLKKLSDAADHLRPILRRWPGTIETKHFKALRGSNAWLGADAIVTLGDPKDPIDSVFSDARYLGVDGTARVDWLARAELEQAHGRLRAPHRKTPARALHVGDLSPLGVGWTDAEQRDLLPPNGRPRNQQTVTPEELRLWVQSRKTLRAAARELGIGHQTLARYLRGERGIPNSVAAAALEWSRKSYSKDSIGVSGPVEGCNPDSETAIPIGVSGPLSEPVSPHSTPRKPAA